MTGQTHELSPEYSPGRPEGMGKAADARQLFLNVLGSFHRGTSLDTSVAIVLGFLHE